MVSFSGVNLVAVRELLGPVRQVGYIVHNVEESAAAWVARFGIGPWRVKHGITFDHCTYQGQPIDIELSMASSYSDGVEIELITQVAGPTSMYSDFLETQGPSAQHVCFYPSDYDAAHAHLVGTDMRVVLEGAIRGTRFAYLHDSNGMVIEIANLSSEGLAVRAERATGAEIWDGAEPLRA